MSGSSASHAAAAAPLKVLQVASECYPLVKTGGLADVVGALPEALRHEGIETRVLLPGYPVVLRTLGPTAVVIELPALFGGPARVLEAQPNGFSVFVIDAPHLYDREGNPYLRPDRRDWPDNAERFAALADVAARIGQGAVTAWRPDVVHAHDWQAGLVAAYLRFRPEAGRPVPPVVMTVHNLAFQGLFPSYLLGRLGLPPSSFTIDGVESFGAVGFLKAGLQLADAITTVSPGYAAEIATESLGMGLGGLFRARADRFRGIVNGLDVRVWDPAQDPVLPASYDRDRLDARGGNREALCARLGLDDDVGPIFGAISRLTEQKGFDLLAAAAPGVVARGGRLAILGSGEAEIEARFRRMAAEHPGRVAVAIGFDEDLAHLMQGSVDALVVPSRFEPCGLTQLAAQRYGAIPVVARTGGLADTVIDANEAALGAGVATGVQFAPVTVDALETAIRRTEALFADRAIWRRLQRNAMALDVSWSRSASRYAALYRSLN